MSALSAKYSTGKSSSWGGLDPDYKPHAQYIWDAARRQYEGGAPVTKGPEVEGMSDAQRLAIQRLQGRSGFEGRGAGYVDQTLSDAEAARRRAADPNAAVTSLDLDPYRETVGSEVSRATEQLNEQILPGINRMFRGSGTGGSTSHAFLTSRALGTGQRAIADATGRIMGGAYDRALDRQQRGDLALTGAGSAAAGMIPALQQAHYMPFQTALDAGGVEQQQRQREKDAELQRYNMEQTRDTNWLDHYVNRILQNPATRQETSQKQGLTVGANLL